MGKQKRSENTYQKINTIFMRDAKNVIMPYEPFTEPEFEYLRGLKWRGEEKIDGTNMRIEVTKEQIIAGVNAPAGQGNTGVKFNVRIAGKTDNAQIPKNLLKHMQEKLKFRHGFGCLQLEMTDIIKLSEKQMIIPDLFWKKI